MLCVISTLTDFYIALTYLALVMHPLSPAVIGYIYAVEDKEGCLSLISTSVWSETFGNTLKACILMNIQAEMSIREA